MIRNITGEENYAENYQFNLRRLQLKKNTVNSRDTIMGNKEVTRMKVQVSKKIPCSDFIIHIKIVTVSDIGILSLSY